MAQITHGTDDHLNNPDNNKPPLESRLAHASGLASLWSGQHPDFPSWDYTGNSRAMQPPG